MSDKNFRVRHGLEVDGSATLSGDLQVDGNDIKGSGGVTAITMNTGRVILADDLTITGNTVTLAQGTDIFYSENNSRLNRPNVQSTTGNTSGFRVSAPNSSSSAVAIVAPFSTNDPLNGKFINIRADGSAGPLSIRTGQYTAGVFGASGNSIDIYDGTTNYASINPAGPTVGTDLTTKTYVDAHPGTTYDIDATSATGGANLNLNGSDSTTDTVKFSGSGGTTVTQTSANEITISSTAGITYDIDATSTTGGANLNLNGSDSSVDTVKFAGSGATTVTQTSANEITISSTDDDTTYTIDASSTTGGANFNLVGSDATTDTIKFSGSGATTVTQTSANEITISSTDNNTTYTIDASSTTGGANLNLVGSDLTTDTVKFASGTGVTVSQTSANEMSIAIGQAVGTGDSPNFAGVTAGNITIGVATDNTITTTNTNGDLTITPNGTGIVVVSTATDTDLVDNTRVLGQLESTTNTNGAYTFPAQSLSTITSGSGIISASSAGGTDGYSAGSSMTHYFADTRAGSNTAPAFTFQGANGNSNPSATIPWTGVAGTAASAQSVNGIMGALNFSTYATTNWASYISGQNQGGGFNVTHPLQIQGYLTETPADGTTTISGATITAVTRTSVNFANVQVTGTRGQISFNATTPAVGNAVAVTGTLTGTATGIAAGTYYVIATNGSTTAQLSATPGGYPITTTAGTTTGLTLTRQFITVTYSTQTNIPFGLNAKIAISGFNNVTSGTYMAQGTSTTTQVLIGAPSSGVPTLSGSQSISCPTVTNAGAGFRVRGMGAATPMNSGNRVNFIDHTAAAATYRSDSFTFAGGAYGGTGATFATLDANEFKPSVPVRYTTTAAGNFAGGSTYTPAATVTNGISAAITSGTGGFTIALTNLLSAGESGHYQIYVNNTSGSNQQVTTTGGVVNINHNLASGSSMMITIYIVDTNAFCEHIA
jgi:hypothetical protein